MPAILDALRPWVPYSVGAFFWADAHGHLTTACASEPGLLGLAGRYVSEFARGPGCVGGVPSIAEMVTRRRPCVVDFTPYRDALRRTELFRDVLAPTGAVLPLVAIVTGEADSVGVLVLLRSSHDRLFGKEDARRLNELLPHLGRALVDHPPATQFVSDGDSGILVTGPQETLLHACVRGRELLHLAAAPDALHQGTLLKSEAELLRAVIEQPAGDSSGRASWRRPPLVIDNPWGRFEFSAAPLASGNGMAGIQVERLVPVAVKMAQSANALPLSPRQRELAVLLGSSLQNDTIADRLGLRPSTVAGMIKDVYHRVGVNSRHAVRELLLHAA